MTALTLRDLAAIDVGRLRGVGEKKRAALATIGVDDLLDLLTFYPRRWVDRSNEARIVDLVPGQEALVLATVRSVARRTTRNRRVMVTANVGDGSGRLDVVFNNAGAGAPPVPIEELTWEQWKTVVDVNLHGVFLCTRAAVAMMKKQSPQGGRIINNGSISAYVPRPNSSPYTATKHAVTGLTRSTSLDGRTFNIACGQIDIGNAATDMTAGMVNGVLQPDGSKRPEPRFDVQHVADAVLYMANLPLDANVQFMTVMATTMPYIARG